MRSISISTDLFVASSPRGRISFGSVALWGLGVGIALAMVLPAAYLLVRSLDGPTAEFFQTLYRPVVGYYLLNTLGLAAVTTFFACLVGIVGGWVTSRSDLPGAKVWAVLLSLPLAVPSYIGAYAYLAAFGPNTRAIIVNTPHNPSGHVATQAELEHLAALCRKLALGFVGGDG